MLLASNGAPSRAGGALEPQHGGGGLWGQESGVVLG